MKIIVAVLYFVVGVVVVGLIAFILRMAFRMVMPETDQALVARRNQVWGKAKQVVPYTVAQKARADKWLGNAIRPS